MPNFQLLFKPIGPRCNLACKYCYYLEKERLYAGTRDFRMTDEVLENAIRQYIAALDVPEIMFAWQGGEPLLLGLDFFRRALELQRQYCPPGRRISNAIQTNGTLLNAQWCGFLRENAFLVGISIDGPRHLHDQYRLDKGGQPTFSKALHGLELLVEHGVEFNTLTVVQRQNARQPLEVYRFLKHHGSRFMQFIPLVERGTGSAGVLAGPPSAGGDAGAPKAGGTDAPVMPWSVEPLAYGEFLCAIFDEWVRNDVGEVYVQMFEVLLAMHVGLPAALCVFAETCGKGLALEHNGDLYACDHYVYPGHKLGNILARPLAELANLPQQIAFGEAKREQLPRQCRACEVLWVCHGECPKHRFVQAQDGGPPQNYLCPGYKRFFTHTAPYIRRLAELVRAGRPAANIMLELSRQERKVRRKK
ncbi:MAG: anaerobic sulfatase maturase [Planctomycetota bacterium]